MTSLSTSFQRHMPAGLRNRFRATPVQWPISSVGLVHLPVRCISPLMFQYISHEDVALESVPSCLMAAFYSPFSASNLFSGISCNTRGRGGVTHL